MWVGGECVGEGVQDIRSLRLELRVFPFLYVANPRIHLCGCRDDDGFISLRKREQPGTDLGLIQCSQTLLA